MNKRPLSQKHHNLLLDIFNKDIDVSNAQIYMKHYPKVTDIKVAAVCVSKLLKKANVQELLKRLRNEAEEKAIQQTLLTVLERKQILAEIARTRMCDFVDPEGKVTLTKQNLSRAGIARIKVTTGPENDDGVPLWKSITVDIRDPIPAIREYNDMEQIGKVPLLQDNRQWNIVVMSEETKALIGRINERLTDAGNERDNHD